MGLQDLIKKYGSEVTIDKSGWFHIEPKKINNEENEKIWENGLEDDRKIIDKHYPESKTE